jgi:hypothetical protein
MDSRAVMWDAIPYQAAAYDSARSATFSVVPVVSAPRDALAPSGLMRNAPRTFASDDTSAVCERAEKLAARTISVPRPS